MKAVVCQEAALEVVELPDPVPGAGQLLLEVVRCGICGSDLHARRHCDEVADISAEVGYEDFMRSSQSVVMGHEFSGRVADHGPGTKRAIGSGTPVVAMPLLRRSHSVHGIGLSAHAPGAYAEQVVVEESLAEPVPNGLAPEVAALTEPLAVGWHAVRRGEVKKGQVAVVVGCGPIGLSVITMLKARGVRTVIASDFSAGRRALASACGADAVLDPAETSPFASASDHEHLTGAPEVLGLAVETVEKLRRVPAVPWWRIWSAAESLGVKPKAPVVFECVGVPGVIDDIIAKAPFFSRIVVVGVCMAPDTLRPAMAINKEVDLRFVIGYTPPEFRQTLHMLADGKVDPRPMVTGTVGLGGVEAAFSALGDPESHAKILIDPKSEAGAPG